MEQDTDYYLKDDVAYVNPTISRDEQLEFINNLRNIQSAANSQIETETSNLGTQVPASQGGLTSGATNADSYFMRRYQTPQVNSQVAALKTTAQLSALNNVMNNYQSQLEQEYQNKQDEYSDAYSAYQARQAAAAAAASSNSSGSSSGTTSSTSTGGVEETSSNSKDVVSISDSFYTPYDADGNPAKYTVSNMGTHTDWSGTYPTYYVQWQDGSTSVGYIGSDNKWYFTSGKYKWTNSSNSSNSGNLGDILINNMKIL